MKYQFNAASALKNKDLLLKRTIALKGLEISKHKGKNNLERCPVLKEPSEWASKKFLGFFGKEEREKKFLTHSR